MRSGQALIQQYTKVITRIRLVVDGKRRGDADQSVAAISRVGLVFEELAAQIDAAGRIPSLTPRQRKLYQESLSVYSNALLHKAQVRCRICVKLAHDLHWWNTWSQGCQAGLRRLYPERFPGGREVFARPGRIDLRPAPADFRTSRRLAP